MRERKSNLRNRKIMDVIITVIIAVCMFTGSMSCMSTTASANSKASYLKSYQKLVKKCNRKFTYTGSQAEMNREACAEYKLWDNELNRVYKKIKSSLSDKRAKQLVASEIKWIKKRDKKADKDAAGWVGGTGYTLMYKSSLTDQTKKRIKWLIRNYA